MGEQTQETAQEPAAPLSEPVFYILISLGKGPKHGYAILKDVEVMSEGSVVLSISTLYSALTRLEDQGNVQRNKAEGVVAPGLPRKVYELTPQGLRMLNAEMGRLKRQVALARRYLAFD
jgi:PadR family transcriptional regulator, regulatory protein PadR